MLGPLPLSTQRLPGSAIILPSLLPSRSAVRGGLPRSSGQCPQPAMSASLQPHNDNAAATTASSFASTTTITTNKKERPAGRTEPCGQAKPQHLQQEQIHSSTEELSEPPTTHNTLAPDDSPHCSKVQPTGPTAPHQHPPQSRTSVDLSSYIAEHRLRAEVVPEMPADQLPPGSAIIKSIVLMADESPQLVVVRGQDRVDERKVAGLLSLPRRRVRLARSEEVLQHTGYCVGTVPPFGHLRPLCTLLDTAVTHLTQAYAGGGDPDRELRVAVPDLLSYSCADVVDASVRSAASAAGASAVSATAVDLPLPWAPGSEEVELVAVVAQRRRIAKLLQFAILIPEQVPVLPPGGQAVYLRKLWCSPDTGTPVEVQLIMGKTLERTFGRPAAEALLDQVKVGSVVAVTGRVQPHPAPKNPSPTHTRSSSPSSQPLSPGPARTASQQEQQQQRRSDVLDVVCHSLTVLHKSKDHLNKALHAARRSGQGSPTSAEELRQLQHQHQHQHPVAFTQGPSLDARSLPTAASADDDLPSADDNPAGSHTHRTRHGDVGEGPGGPGQQPPVQPLGVTQRQAEGAEHTEETITSAFPVAAESSFETGTSGVSLRASAPLPTAVTTTGHACWRMPLPDGAIRWVANAAEVEAMRVEVLGVSGGGGGGDSVGISGGWPVVGLDCEWVPYERHQPRTPVAILQVATRHSVYIVDMLQLMRPDGDSTATHGSKSTPRSPHAAQSGVGGSTVIEPLSAGALAISGFLSSLFAAREVIKLGFQLSSDVARLRESYPALPCFFGGNATASCKQRGISEGSGSKRINDGSTPRVDIGAKGGGGEGYSSGGAGNSCTDSSDSDGAEPGACHMCIDVVALARAIRPELVRTPQISLSRLVALVLSTPLDKTQQRSDWAYRPLSSDQLLYAATDAYCLVALYDTLLGLNEFGTNDMIGDVSVLVNNNCNSSRSLERALSIVRSLPAALRRLP